MAKKLFGFIDNKPFIWFHYLPLVGVMYIAHHFSTNSLFNLETLTQTNPALGWALMTIWYYAFFLVGDNLIHTIGGVD